MFWFHSNEKEEEDQDQPWQDEWSWSEGPQEFNCWFAGAIARALERELPKGTLGPSEGTPDGSAEGEGIQGDVAPGSMGPDFGFNGGWSSNF